VRTLPERFWQKVDLTLDCWLWQGARNDHGYGMIRRDGAPTYAHRWSYEALVGPIPPERELDHLCRVRTCVRPDHLEAVSHRTNLLRARAFRDDVPSTHCPRGHAFAGFNLYVRPDGRRACRACHRIDQGRYRARRGASGVG
jgi:hypothetical protein